MATVLRAVKLHRPQIVVADGQGALIALALSRPLLLESCMALRNIQLSEVPSLAKAWGAIRVIIVSQPRVGKAKLDVHILRQAVPELFDDTVPWPSLEAVAIDVRDSPTYEQEKELKRLMGVPTRPALEDIFLKEHLAAPPSDDVGT